MVEQKAPVDLEERLVRTKVRYWDEGLVGVPDIVVETSSWMGLVICRVEAAPDLGELATFRALCPDAELVVLAPKRVVDGLRNSPTRAPIPGTNRTLSWSDVRLGNWVDLLSLLVNRRVYKGEQDPFRELREAFADLGAEFGFVARRPFSAELWSKVPNSNRKLQSFRPAMRAAVRALLPLSAIPEPLEAGEAVDGEGQEEGHQDPGDTGTVPTAHWVDGTMLDTYWEADAPPGNLPFRSLGFEVLPRAGLGSFDLQWVLVVTPTEPTKDRLRYMAGHWRETDHDWYLDLSTFGSPDDTLGDQLEAAVSEARWWLQQDPHIGRATKRLTELPDEPVESIHEYLSVLAQFEHSVQGWMQWLRAEVMPSMTPLADEAWKVREINDRLGVWTGTTEVVWLYHESNRKESGGLSLVVNWGPLRNQLLQGVLSSVYMPRGLQRKFGRDSELRISLRTANASVEEFARWSANLLQRLFTESRAAVLPPFTLPDRS